MLHFIVKLIFQKEKFFVIPPYSLFNNCIIKTSRSDQGWADRHRTSDFENMYKTQAKAHFFYAV